jgi:hypothetical protein
MNYESIKQHTEDAGDPIIFENFKNDYTDFCKYHQNPDRTTVFDINSDEIIDDYLSGSLSMQLKSFREDNNVYLFPTFTFSGRYFIKYFKNEDPQTDEFDISDWTIINEAQINGNEFNPEQLMFHGDTEKKILTIE